MSTELPPTRRDGEVLQILATEHWSLLATRALTYQESLGRVNMFLTILSGGVIVASAGGAIAALAAQGFGAPVYGVLLAGAAAFVASLAAIMRSGRRSFRRYGPGIETRFPSPPKPQL